MVEMDHRGTEMANQPRQLTNSPLSTSQLSSLVVAVTEVGGGGLGMRLEQTVYILPVQSAYCTCTCSFT